VENVNGKFNEKVHSLQSILLMAIFVHIRELETLASSTCLPPRNLMFQEKIHSSMLPKLLWLMGSHSS